MCQLQTCSEPITDKKTETPWADCLCSKGHKKWQLLFSPVHSSMIPLHIS